MIVRPISALVIDDELLAIEGLKRLCSETGQVNVIGEATDGKTALELIEKLRPDAVFLDISMPGLSGLDVAVAIAHSNVRPLITFVTAHDHYATQAFDLSVVDYVLKPIETERIRRAIERMACLVGILDKAATVPTEFWVPYRGRIVKLGVDQIHRIDAERDYVRLISSDISYLVRATLTEMQNRLNPDQFVRIHRSIIVARDHIIGFRHIGAGAWVVVCPNGTEAPIGRSYLAAVRETTGLRA